jgi:hypothetical protein
VPPCVGRCTQTEHSFVGRLDEDSDGEEDARTSTPAIPCEACYSRGTSGLGYHPNTSTTTPWLCASPALTPSQSKMSQSQPQTVIDSLLSSPRLSLSLALSPSKRGRHSYRWLGNARECLSTSPGHPGYRGEKRHWKPSACNYRSPPCGGSIGSNRQS